MRRRSIPNKSVTDGSPNVFSLPFTHLTGGKKISQSVHASHNSDSLLKNPLEELICTGGEYARTLPVTSAQINSKEILRSQERSRRKPKRREDAASAAPSGHGRRPHRRFLSSRFKFCPAARMSASHLTRQSRRRRKRRMPCQSLPEAYNGSTQPLRLRMAF